MLIPFYAEPLHPTKFCNLQIDIKYELTSAILSLKHQQASGRLKMPSRLPARYPHNVGHCAELIMNLGIGEDVHCLNVMRSCNHENILHPGIIKEVIIGDSSFNVAWMERYTRVLSEYVQLLLSTARFHAPVGATVLLPSPHLQMVLRSAVGTKLSEVKILRVVLP